MLPCVHFFVSLSDVTFRVDHIGDPLRTFSVRAIARTISHTECFFRVTEQWIFKIILLCKRSVRDLVIGADTQNLNTLLFKRVDSIPESLAFSRSAAGVRPGIEPHHHGFPAQVLETHDSPRVIRNTELRCLCTHLEHIILPSKVSWPPRRFPPEYPAVRIVPWCVQV